MLIVPAAALFAPIPVVLFPPVTLPVMVNTPVELLFAPYEVPPVPPVTSPVMLIVPVDVLFVPNVFVVVPPVEFPVIVTFPVDVFSSPYLLDTLPPVTLPTTATVPAPDIVMPLSGPAVTFPVTVAVPLACEQRNTAPPLCPVADSMFAVTLYAAVIAKYPLLEHCNFPLPKSTFWSMVTVNVLGLAVSPVVGSTPPTHVDVLDQFPVCAAVTTAILYAS
jgi:hypothetical protein